MTAYSDALTIGGKTREAGQQTLINIDIDKNQYLLQSFNYLQDVQGTSIDLSTGGINSYNFYLSSNNVLIDSREKINQDDPYFKITGKYQDEGVDSSYVLMEVGLNKYYLQSWHYAASLEGNKFSNTDNGEGVGYFEIKIDEKNAQYYKGMSIDLVTGTLYSCQVDNVPATKYSLDNIDGRFKDEINAIAIYFLGRQGLMIDQRARGNAPVLSAGNFNVSAQGTLLAGGDWIFSLRNGMGALTPFGVSPLGTVISTISNKVDSKLLDLLLDATNLFTSISWTDIYLTVLRAKMECFVDGGIMGGFIGFLEKVFGAEDTAQYLIDTLFKTLYTTSVFI